MMIHLARASWPFEGSKVKDSGSFTLEQVEQHYKLYKKQEKAPVNILYSLGTDRMHHNGNRALKNAIKNGRATIQQSDETEGWGISTSSLEEAKQLALATAARHRTQEEVETNKERLAANKQVVALRNLTLKQLKTPVHFYFKQDYSYRGLDSSFKGTIKLAELVEYSVAHLTDDNDLVDQIEAKYNKKCKSSDFEYSLSEAFNLEPKLIEKLLKKGSVSTSEEIGYEAFSLKSVKHARELVAQAVVRTEMDD